MGRFEFSVGLLVILSMVFTPSHCIARDDADTAIQNTRGFRFETYDVKISDYSYPAFKFSIKAPDGTIIGWDEVNNQWTGDVKESRMRTEPFAYPYPDQECTSNIEYTVRRFGSLLGICGGYDVNTALYCRSVVTGENTFMSSGYSGNIANTPDGKYEVTLITNKYAVVKFEYTYLLDDVDNEGEFERYLIIFPNSTQTLEIKYDFIIKAENKIKKVVTPSLLVGEWEGCNQLGLIKNRGIFTSINKKLEAAKAKREAGDLETAANINNAAINEIKAQYGKGIDRLCADILLEDLTH